MKTAPDAEDLAGLCSQCSAAEWTRLAQSMAFIEAAGDTLEAAAKVASEFTGREIFPRLDQKPSVENQSLL